MEMLPALIVARPQPSRFSGTPAAGVASGGVECLPDLMSGGVRSPLCPTQVPQKNPIALAPKSQPIENDLAMTGG